MTFDDGRVYVYNDAIATVHGTPFDPASSDWKVHVSHTPKGERDINLHFLLSEMERGAEIMRSIVEHSRRHAQIFSTAAAQARLHPSRKNRMDPLRSYVYFHVWGCDYLVTDSMDVLLIELNAFPNLNHGNAPRGQPSRAHELRYRARGFDRDLVKLLGLEPWRDSETPMWVCVSPSAAQVELDKCVRPSDAK